MRRILSALLAPFAIVAIAPAVVTFVPAGEAVAGGGCHSEELTDASGTAVDLSENCFSPTVIRVGSGESVTFTNQDPVAHTVTGVANSWGTYDEFQHGESVVYQFDSSGVFPYFCVVHPSMVGAVVVGDGAAAASEASESGVKAVSAVAPGADAAEEESAPVGNDGGDGDSPWVIAGVVLAVGVVGTGIGLVVGKRRAAQ